MNVKAISTNVGKALLVSALFMFLSIIVSLVNGRDSAFGPLTISFIITLITGYFPFIFVKKSQSLSLQDGFLTIVLSWVLSFIFGMLPYVLWGGEFTLINAWFESVSGYTTTGATKDLQDRIVTLEGLTDVTNSAIQTLEVSGVTGVDVKVDGTKRTIDFTNMVVDCGEF